MDAEFDWFAWFTAHPLLKFLFLELTDRCNLQCLHCGSACSAQNSRFLPREAVAALLRRVADAYPPRQMMLCITGGEPLLHPDFFEIMQDAAELGFAWGMTTNGTLITPETARRLKRARMGSVAVSLDGLEAQHDELRAQPGSYARAVQGIRAMRDAGLRVQVTSVIHKKNIGSLEEMLDGYARLGVYSWKPICIEPIGRAREQDGLLLDREEHMRLLRFIRDKRRDPDCPMEVTYGCSHYLPDEFERQVRYPAFRCGAGIFIASVMCNGDIGGCLDIERREELIQGNVFRDDFVDVWENRFARFREDRALRSSLCRSCPDRHDCHGDSAHTWDYDRQEPRICLRMPHEEERA